MANAGAAVESTQLAAKFGTDAHSAAADAAVQSAKLAAKSGGTVQPAAASAKSGEAVQSTAAAARSGEAAQSAAVAAGVAPGGKAGGTLALVPPPPAAEGHSAAAAEPAATAGVQGSETKALLAGVAPKSLDVQDLAEQAATVSTPAKLQASAGRKLRAAAAAQPLVRHSARALLAVFRAPVSHPSSKSQPQETSLTTVLTFATPASYTLSSMQSQSIMSSGDANAETLKNLCASEEGTCVALSCAGGGSEVRRQ